MSRVKVLTKFGETISTVMSPLLRLHSEGISDL